MKKTGSISVEGCAFISGDDLPGFFRRVTIAIEDGIIREVVSPRGGDLVFGDDYLIYPGFIDMHVHCREDPSGKHNYKEDFETAGRAAVQGGVVAVVDMPNNPLPPDTAERYSQKKKLSEKSQVDVLLYGLARPGREPFDPDIPYKLFLSDDFGVTKVQVKKFLKDYANCWVSVHAEDPVVLKKSSGARTHGERRPREAEIDAVKKLLSCLEDNPCLHLHFCHVSVSETVKLIEKARRAMLPVSCEVCFHHLFFDEANFPSESKEFANVNPPLRTANDREYLVKAIERGEIDTLVTDHAPHLPDEKRDGASGFPGLDAYGNFATFLAKTLPPFRFVGITSGFAARFWNRFTVDMFGVINPGAVGSLTVLGPSSWPGIKKKTSFTKCGWSPYTGYTFPGEVRATIVRGLLKRDSFMK